jgi:tRNA nucleotidyltransferase (CCA-adding enzyme)
MSPKIELPEDVSFIISELSNKGFEAYAVGGCIRDVLLNKKPKDWDIATNALTSQVKEIFPKSIDTGINHGTVTIILNKINYEITTFREEGKYSDRRRPDKVFFTESLKTDLSRRDFTINAMAFNPNIGIVDLFDGISDIKNKIIKTVGKPEDRFSEDALRMLRAVRFSAQLNFQIDAETSKGIISNSKNIDKISVERIRSELEKIVISDYPSKVKELYRLGLMDRILPELSKCFETLQNHPYHIYNVGDHIVKSIENIESSPFLRWTMLFHDIGKAYCRTTDDKGIDHFYNHGDISVRIAQVIMKRLKFDNKTMDKVSLLVKNHDLLLKHSESAIRKATLLLGIDCMYDLFKVMKADKCAQNPRFLEKSNLEIKKIENEFETSLKNNHCMSKKELNINGDNLKELGITDGREIGMIMKILLDMVIESPELNKREELLELASLFYKNKINKIDD